MKKTELTEKELDAIAAAGSQTAKDVEEVFVPVSEADTTPTEPSEATKKAFEDMQKAVDKLGKDAL